MDEGPNSSLEEFNDHVKKWVEDTREFVISNAMLNTIMIGLSVILNGIIAIAGVLSNSVNVLVFIRLGLKDSMSVGLWALSFTDLVVSVLHLCRCTSYLFAIMYPFSQVDYWIIGRFYFGWARYVCYFISCWITTLIALERCYCVVSPFKVKQVFTKTKCVAFILVMCAIHIAMLIQIYVYPFFQWGRYSTDQKDTNGSDIYFMQMKLQMTVETAQAQFNMNIVVGVVLSVTSQVLIILCTVWMIYSLKSSSRIRKSAISRHRERADNLSPREKRLVKIVIMLAIIQTVGSIPRFFVTIVVHHVLRGVQLGTYNNLGILMWEVANLFGTVYDTSKPVSSITRQALSWNTQGKMKRDRPQMAWRFAMEDDTKKNGYNW
ncbi:uncharacterized protein LOC131941853 [Physella acuta]|uniref:uncharacterized protein LOC131941853 n=1 Tax=Physella acuta TaxID=109671 RepID=UPI0027DDD980|nr:uncharacterized protein LOC131941853 [Physella acuta]